MPKLVYTKKAIDDIQKLDIVAKKRIKKKMEECAADPFLYAKKLTNSVMSSYRWRIGNYRVAFDVDEDKIVVLRVGHRRETYK